MGAFIDAYKKLLIIQYADKEKANKHIEALLGGLEEIYGVGREFEEAFDLDLAVGKQLDIIGKIVGLSRIVPFAIPKNYFGFADNPNSFGFGDKFADVTAYPLKNKFEIPYTDAELNDTDYRFFLRAKIAKNNAKAKMIGNLSIQDLIDYLFESKAYVVDNKDMSFNIYINDTYDFAKIRYILQLDLIPRPQGVKIAELISYKEGNTFGFEDNPNSKGFGDKFADTDGGYFAEKIIY